MVVGKVMVSVYYSCFGLYVCFLDLLRIVEEFCVWLCFLGVDFEIRINMKEVDQEVFLGKSGKGRREGGFLRF